MKQDVKRMNIPSYGDVFTLKGSKFTVDWVCESGGNCEIGLSGCGMTWTGPVSKMKDIGFKEEAK